MRKCSLLVSHLWNTLLHQTPTSPAFKTVPIKPRSPAVSPLLGQILLRPTSSCCARLCFWLQVGLSSCPDIHSWSPKQEESKAQRKCREGGLYSFPARALESSWAQWLLLVILVENWESLSEHDEKKKYKIQQRNKQKTRLHASVTRENSGLVVEPAVP